MHCFLLHGVPLGARAGFLSIAFVLLLTTGRQLHAQPDTLLRHIQLSEVVISARAQGFDVDAFVRQVRLDTTFHKAFLNTRYYPNQVRSALRVHNKGEKETASLFRSGRLKRSGPMAVLALDSVVESGKLRDRKGRVPLPDGGDVRRCLLSQRHIRMQQ
jgi:hypothetical protein